MPLTVQIVTPENVTYSGEAESVTIPGMDGELGILPGHISLIVPIVPGVLQVKEKSDEKVLAVGAGFVEVDNDTVSVLTDMAVSEDDSEAAAAEAIKRAAEAMRQKDGSGVENDTMSAALAAAFAQIKGKRRI